ncbi:MAG: transcriptional regulator [Phycisphaerae bacterium]|nr:transcriptional regulator [Saprospiraceae bacterium]
MLKPIRTESQYEASLERIYELMQIDLEPGTELGDELEILSILVKEFENLYYPMPKPHPIEAIKFRLEQMGLSEAELIRILGSRSRKSEILSGERKLSLEMIRKLNRELRIPAEVLIQAY